MTVIIDSDQHLHETRSMWRDHIDPKLRDEAIRIVDDELGYSWLTWRDKRLQMTDVQVPGDTKGLGRRRELSRENKPPEYLYDEALPDHYWEPAARVEQIKTMGLDEAVVFPNFGLLWERRLSGSLPALTANMAAWNRWCSTVVKDSGGKLHPVAHLTLRDPEWLETQLSELSSAGVRLGMIAPAAVDGRPLSHPDHDRLWAAFVRNGVTPVFHVADQPRVLDEAFYPDPEESFVPALESIFIWVPPAIAVTDLIVNGVLAKFPELRIAIVELASIWVPQYLLMLDGGWEFTSVLNGEAPVQLDLRPSEYFRRQVRVSSFSYEQPGRLTAKSGDLFMCCSDYPHSEGTATPMEDYERIGLLPEGVPGLFHDNVAELLTA
ncbi:MAG TPA: amidohydrolase family protein [Acidimicrobiales bacterium]|nr:amidohydrolase family protein [Acidimicrobiales bacterium]